MSSVLLDTNVAGFLLYGDPRLAAYLPDLQGASRLFVSFQTVAEMLYGAEKDGWGPAKRAKLNRDLQRFRVASYDREVGDAWAFVMAESERQGFKLEGRDAWVAAAAYQRRITLLAHDTDFRGFKIPGLTVVCHVP